MEWNGSAKVERRLPGSLVWTTLAIHSYTHYSPQWRRERISIRRSHRHGRHIPAAVAAEPSAAQSQRPLAKPSDTASESDAGFHSSTVVQEDLKLLRSPAAHFLIIDIQNTQTEMILFGYMYAFTARANCTSCQTRTVDQLSIKGKPTGNK